MSERRLLLISEQATEILRLRAENEKLRAALVNLWAAAYDLPQTKECRLYGALQDADEILKEAK